MIVSNRKNIAYAAGLSAVALILQWVDFHYAARLFPLEFYLVVLAVIFTAAGIWLGMHFTRPDAANAAPPNEKAIRYLGISARERDVLVQLAGGLSNREIAAQLHVSTSTVKTHLVHVYGKLDVSRRTQAVQKARSLGIVR